MALVDDFIRHADTGILPAGLALTVAGNAADAALLDRAIRHSGPTTDTVLSAGLVTTLNTLTGRTLTAPQWSTLFARRNL